MQIKALALSLLLAVTGVTASDNSAISYLSSLGITYVSNGPTATNLANALQSAYSSMATRKDAQSAFSVLHTAVPDKVWDSISASGIKHIETTAPPSWYTGLPKDVKKQLLSEQSVADSIITSVLKIKTAGAGVQAQPTAGVALGGAAVAGVLGVVAML